MKSLCPIIKPTSFKILLSKLNSPEHGEHSTRNTQTGNLKQQKQEIFFQFNVILDRSRTSPKNLNLRSSKTARISASVKDSCSVWPAPSCGTRESLCLTKRRRRSTARRTVSCRRRSEKRSPTARC